MADRHSARLVSSPQELADAFALRHQVFVGEQQVPPELERDDLDETAVHAVAYDDQGGCVGAGRLVVRGQVGSVGRMAVRADARQTGVGTVVLACLETAARERGLAAVELHAQRHAEPFYLAHGYQRDGDPFEEAGIAHQGMRKQL